MTAMTDLTDLTGKVSFIDAYTDRLSAPQGGEIGFCVSTDMLFYDVEIARIGARREVVWRQRGFSGREHPVPADASERGCGWPLSFTVQVGADWPSGYYEAEFRGEGEGGFLEGGTAAFVVRSAHPGRDAAILLQRPTNTEAAYNSFGGSTFYNGPQGPARRLSFERPFAGFPWQGRLLFAVSAEFAADLDRGTVSEALADALASGGLQVSPWRNVLVDRPGERWHILDVGFLLTVENLEDGQLLVLDGFSAWLSCWHRWERHFVAWAEAAGYAIDYAVNGDLESMPELLEDYRLVLSVGHDEYWSAPMRDSLEGFVEAGGNAAFFSGNVSWWQVRSEEEGRALVCWKEEFEKDPHFASGDHATLSTLWCHRLVGRPENRLTGVSFAYGGYHGFFSGTPQTGAYTVHRPGHWLFEGTGLKQGDLLGEKDRIVSYECDGCEFELVDGLPVPTGRDGTPESFEILATAPASLSDADNSIAMASEAIYGPGAGRRLTEGAAVLGTFSRGGTVVTTGCTDWCMGLKGGDPAVDRITRNILDRLSA